LSSSRRNRFGEHFLQRVLSLQTEDLRRSFIFPDKVVLDNRSTIFGEEAFLRGLELATGAKKTIVAVIQVMRTSNGGRTMV